VIANEFGEAQGLHRSALVAAGLVLFVLTLLVNGLARVLVSRAAHPSKQSAGAAGGGTPAIAGAVAGA
jgi:phosphate transport system permease protein